MPTIRQQILTAAVEALNTDRPPGVPEATLRRILPESTIEEPRISVFFNTERAEARRGPHDTLTTRTLQLVVQVADVTSDVAELDELLEPMLAWAVAALGDNRLGGLVHWTRESGTQWAHESMDRFYAKAAVVFDVEYHTNRDDAYTKA